MTDFWGPALTLLEREVVRFYRERSRVVGALAPPIMFWFLIGSGLAGTSLAPGVTAGNHYFQTLFPGTITLIILFTAIFSMISVIEDRREGFLQAVLVAPVPRLSIVLGKVLGGSILAFLQGLTFVVLAPAVGLHLSLAGLPALLGALFLVSMGLAGLGFWLAWRLDSTQGFHAIMNLLLIPMWLLSGAIFPTAGAPAWLKLVMQVNPVTYCVAALQHGLMIETTGLPSQGSCILVSAAFAGVMLAGSCWEAGR